MCCVQEKIKLRKVLRNKDQNSILQNMAKSLGGLAALADYGSSMSEDSESESEGEVVAKFDTKKNHETIEIDDSSTSADESSDTENVAKFDTMEQFIKNGLLSSIVKESVRRV